MSTLLAAGGFESELDGLDVVAEPGQTLNFVYAAPMAEGGVASYPVTAVRRSLTAVVRPTERGWVAIASAVNALGYGAEPNAAVADLLDSVEQYLSFLSEETPELAPSIAHHADFVGLLGAPRSVWLASVSVDASPVE